MYQYVLLSLFVIVLTRLWIVIRNTHHRTAPKKRSVVKIMIVVGSGGHTYEILQLVGSLESAYQPRIYVVANTDTISQTKICSVEMTMSGGSYLLQQIPRSREVNQSYVTSVWTTLNSLLYSVPLVYRHKPDVLLCNGPGTCIPICLAAFMFNVMTLTDCIIVYVESICRAETLSLSGKILYYIAHEFIVQWPQLQKKFPRAKYLGRLV